jgi:CBS domain containing-hemolysin-like protein
MAVLVAIIFLFGNAFFVGAQFALITVRRDQLEPMVAARRRGAGAALAQTRSLPRMLAGSQLGIALCSLGLGAVAEPAFAHNLEGLFDALSLPASFLHPVAFVLALGFISFCHMVLGEMVPKNISLADPTRAALWLGPPIAGWVLITRPILVVIDGLANAVLRIVRIVPKSELDTTYTPEEFGQLFTESAGEGLLDQQDEQRLARALALNELVARSVVIPLDSLVTVAADVTPRELERLVASTGYSRFPIRTGNELTAYVHVKDILDIDAAHWDEPVPAVLARPMAAIDAELSLSDALLMMQRSGTHIACVTDNGATLGMLALEDMLEQLVGDVTAA